mmetsp:Transcript_23438/g.49542  ORF Transcript_23438/g.49542 Transcript_23438/m.49542 type:complete len:248 (+) Transcript_23438:1186-1929(+)
MNGPYDMLATSTFSPQLTFFSIFFKNLPNVMLCVGALLLPLMIIRSQIVCVFPFIPSTSSAGMGAVNAKNGNAKFTNAFRYIPNGSPFNNFTSSRQLKADTNPVVVIMAGTIRPATLLVSIASAGGMPYAIARRLEAAVTKATWPFDSSSFSKSARFKRGRKEAPVLAPFNLSSIRDRVSSSLPSLLPPPDRLWRISVDFFFLYSSFACSSRENNASSSDIEDGDSSLLSLSLSTSRNDSIRNLAAD